MIKRVLKIASSLYARFIIGSAAESFVSIRAELRGDGISIGSNCRILKYSKLDTSTNPSSADFLKFSTIGRITIGNRVKIKEYAFLYSYDGFIVIDDDCTINPFTIIYGQGGVTIGKNVMIAAQCILVSSNHRFDSTEIPMAQQGLSKLGITIGDDVWIGSSVKVLDGVTIGRGSIVAAGSVVTKSLDEFGIYAGIPAKLIRKRLGN